MTETVELPKEHLRCRTSLRVSNFLPDISWVKDKKLENTPIEILKDLPDEVGGNYDWETGTVRVSLKAITEAAKDVYEVKRRSSSDEFKDKIERNWLSWNDEARRSAIITYLYLRAFESASGHYDELKKLIAREIVLHETRHAYDAIRGYKEQLGQVGPVEMLASLARLENSPVYGRFLALCIESYWLQEIKEFNPASLQEKIGVVIIKTLLGFIEDDHPQVRGGLADKLKFLAFLPSVEFKKLCEYVRNELEKQIYAPKG